MGTARRLYLYIVSMVSLLALTTGAGSLLQLFLQRAQDAVAGASVIGGGISSTQAALSIAMIAVGAPVWGLHWWLIRRGVRSGADDGAEDRASAVRAWYLAVVMGIALAASVFALVSLLSEATRAVVGAAEDPGWSLPLAVALVALPVWAVHARMRWREIRSTPMRGAAAWVTRLYRYLASYAVLVLLLSGAAGLIETVLSVAAGRAGFDPEGTWWRTVAAGQFASLVVGAAAWAIHWWETGATVRDAALTGEDERVTRLRAAFFGGSVLTTLAWVAMGAASAIASAGRLLTGMTPDGWSAWLEDVVGPPVALLPVAVAAWWLTAAARHEAAAVGRLQVLAARRLTTLLASLTGLAFLAAGIIQLLETGLFRLGGAPTAILYGEDENVQVPWYVAQVLVGAVLWLPAWRSALEARRREPELERTAAASRAYLFLVVGTALVAAVPATIAIVYRLLVPLLGGASSAAPLADLSFPLAVLAVAIVVGAYHARILFGDLALRTARPPAPAEPVPQTAPAMPPEGAGWPAGREPVPEHAAIVELVLEIDDGDDAPTVVAGLQSHLPPGARLRVRPVG